MGKKGKTEERRASKDVGKERRASVDKKEGAASAVRRSGARRPSANAPANNTAGPKRRSREAIIAMFNRGHKDGSVSGVDNPSGASPASPALAQEQTRKAEEWMRTWTEDGMIAEWEELQKTYQVLPSGYSTTAFDAAEAKKKRYPTAKMLDQTRVKLGTDGLARTDFINASFVTRIGSKAHLILAAAPTKDTLADWWTMIYQQKVGIIVMLCQTTEDGKSKCEPYVPESKDKPMTVKPPTGKGAGPGGAKAGEVEVVLEDETMEMVPGMGKEPALRVCHLAYTYPSKLGPQRKKVEHIQFLGWPDQGAPATAHGIVHLLDVMEKEAASMIESTRAPADAPVLIHCSAGLGRSGTLAAIDTVLRHITGSVPRVPSVPDVVRQIRKERFLAVQTWPQYHFIYAAVVTALKQRHVFKHNHRVPRLT